MSVVWPMRSQYLKDIDQSEASIWSHWPMRMLVSGSRLQPSHGARAWLLLLGVWLVKLRVTLWVQHKWAWPVWPPAPQSGLWLDGFNKQDLVWKKNGALQLEILEVESKKLRYGETWKQYKPSMWKIQTSRYLWYIIREKKTLLKNKTFPPLNRLNSLG